MTSTAAISPRSIQCEPGDGLTLVRTELTILFRTSLFSLKQDAGTAGRWINLSPFESDEFGVPRAYVNLTTTAAENTLANAMDAAILQLANQLAGNNPANIQITSQDRDGLGTTYHEAGTLWMGTNPQTSVTDTNGRFHNVANAFCADQSLFVTVGSVNPTLTGLVLSRKVAQAAVALATGAHRLRKHSVHPVALNGSIVVAVISDNRSGE